MNININKSINTKNFPTGMKNKITWIILCILIIVLFSLFLAKSTGEDSWICTESGWIQHGKPNSIKPLIPCGKIEKEKLVENYLKENISEISTIKEALGGKFYITKIIWAEDNSGIVEYEDGHILLKASFEYEVKIDQINNSYSIIINNFKTFELNNNLLVPILTP